MNKLAVAAAALLLIVLLALPRVVGSVAETHVRQRVAEIDADPRASAELRSFEQGWFGSTARIELKVAPEAVSQAADAAGTPLGVFSVLPIVVELAHGPIAMLDGVYFGWSKMVVRPDLEAPGVGELTRTLGVPYVFEFRGRSDYFGELVFDADAPPFELPIDEALLTFAGATLEGTFAEPHLAAEAQVGSVTFTSPTGTFAVRGVQANVDNELRSRYLMPGDSSFSIESISVAGPVQGASPLFEASNVRVRSNVEVDAAGELLDARLDYDLDSLRIEENDLTAASLVVTAQAIDVAAVEAYGAVATEVAGNGDPLELAAALGPHLERAFKAGPSLTLDPIRFRYEGEPFEGRVEIRTIPERLPPAGTLSLENPIVLAGVVDADAELRLSKSLAGELATLSARLQLAADPSIPLDQLDYMAEAQSGLMLTQLLGLGVLVEDGDTYRLSLDYTEGRLTLNGSVLPFGLP